MWITNDDFIFIKLDLCGLNLKSMTPLEVSQIGEHNLHKANLQPAKTEKEVKKLRDQVALLRKVVNAIVKTLPEEQIEKIKILMAENQKRIISSTSCTNPVQSK